jgi:hypothetical protein
MDNNELEELDEATKRKLKNTMGPKGFKPKQNKNAPKLSPEELKLAEQRTREAMKAHQKTIDPTNGRSGAKSSGANSF